MKSAYINQTRTFDNPFYQLVYMPRFIRYMADCIKFRCSRKIVPKRK